MPRRDHLGAARHDLMDLSNWLPMLVTLVTIITDPARINFLGDKSSVKTSQAEQKRCHSPDSEMPSGDKRDNGDRQLSDFSSVHTRRSRPLPRSALIPTARRLGASRFKIPPIA